MRWLLLPCAFVLGASPYLHTLRFGFAYDDEWTIVSNPWLRQPLAGVLRHVLQADAAARVIPDATRPAMLVSTWLDHALYGTWAAGYHLTSVLFHGALTVVFLVTALRLLRRRWPALVATSLFALSPAHAEAVAAVNYREDLLVGLGLLTALAALAHAPSVRQTALALAGFALALLSKESAVVLPAMVAVLALAQPRTGGWLFRRREAVVALIALGVAWAAWRWGLTLAGVDVPRAPAGAPFETLLRTARYELWALSAPLLPGPAIPVHPPRGAAGLGWLVALAALVGATAWLLHRPRWRTVGLGIGLSLTAALGTSPLVGPFNEHADRYLLLPSIGVSLVLGDLLGRAASPARHRAAVTALALLLLSGLVTVTVWRTLPWQDNTTLWHAAVERAPHSPRTWTGLAFTLRQASSLDAADEAVDRAIALDPGYVPAQVTRTFNQLMRGDVAGARRTLQTLDELGANEARGVRRARYCARLDTHQAARCAAGVRTEKADPPPP